jgi:hypothetical protein
MSKITEATRDHIADENFAFPNERKEPIHDAAHVRNAIARFKQVQGADGCGTRCRLETDPIRRQETQPRVE